MKPPTGSRRGFEHPLESIESSKYNGFSRQRERTGNIYKRPGRSNWDLTCTYLFVE
jgi:hypothetical protein